MKTGTSVGIACAVGVAGGIMIGFRAVKIYDWRTEWTILAPMPFVYKAMTSRQAVREWWPDMELVEDNGDDDLHVGSTVSFRVHQAPEVARLAPAFCIHCLYTDVEPERRLRETVSGDLNGVTRDSVPRAARRDLHNILLVRAPDQPGSQPPGVRGRTRLPP